MCFKTNLYANSLHLKKLKPENISKFVFDKVYFPRKYLFHKSEERIVQLCGANDNIRWWAFDVK